MDSRKRFFSKRAQDFEQVPQPSHQTVFFWPEPIYWNINFVLKCLPAQCDVDVDVYFEVGADIINDIEMEVERGCEWCCQ